MSTVNQKIFKVHSWLGLFNGVWLLILGITGSLLVYTMELDKWVNKDILTVKPAEHRLPVDSLYKIVRAKYPKAMGANIIRFPKEKTDCISFKIYVEDGSKPMSKWDDTFNTDIDPYTGKILREGAYSDINSSFLFWSGNLHWSLNYGEVGVLIVTIAGILLFINIITGIIIYRKYFFRAMIFRAPIKWKNWRTGTSGLHRYIGVWSLILNILIFYSGLQMTWGSLDKNNYKKPVPITPNTEEYASIDKMMADVQKIYPGFEFHYFFIPFGKTVINGVNLGYASAMGYIPGTPSVVPLSASSVNFDVNTGALVSKVNANEELKKKNLWDKFNYIAYSFHAGTFLGQFSRILYVIVGLTPAFLAISGFMLWLRRRKVMR
ncbi:MAG: PepSY-associated TM helix domain-containing protein [Sphingobacteriales bacterium]